jgi:hypothetical protein
MTLIESGLQQVPKGPTAVHAWLRQHPDALEPAFVEEISQQALAAMQRGAPDIAAAAFLLTGCIHQQRGDAKGALTSQVQHVEVMFMVAQTTDAYEQAHDLALNLAAHAVQARFTDLAFWAFALAADSAYWGSDSAPDAATRKRWLRAAVNALLTTEPLSPSNEFTAVWARFVSSLVATYQTTMQQTWGSDQAAVDASLRRLASLAERLIPVTYAFDDPKKTAHVAHHLADLSVRYGSQKAAEQRLRAAQQAVKSDKWDE